MEYRGSSSKPQDEFSAGLSKYAFENESIVPAPAHKLEIHHHVKQQFETDLNSQSEETDIFERDKWTERGSGMTTTSLVLITFIGVTATFIMLSLAFYVIYTFVMDCLACCVVQDIDHL